MTLDFIRGVQILIVAFLSYVITITFAGWFESWMAKQMGDDTPEQLGFLTLNPLEHFNVFGFAAVLWGIFYARLLPFQLIPGWGRYIPLLPDTMRGKNLRLRGFVEFIGRSIAHLILLLITSTIIIFLYRYHFIAYTGSHASFLKVISVLLTSLISQNLILFVVHFTVGVFKYIIHFHVPRLDTISWERIILGFFILTIGIIILRPILEDIASFLIIMIQVFFVSIGL